MAPIVSTTLAVNELDGDLGDPRGVIELVAARSGQDTPMDDTHGTACANCGARLQPLASTPEPAATA